MLLLKRLKETIEVYKDFRYLPQEDFSFSVLIVVISMIVSTLFSIAFGTYITISTSAIFAIIHFSCSILLILVYTYSAIKVMYDSHQTHTEHNMLFPYCGLCDKEILTSLKKRYYNNETNRL
jgi:hypothetical protein